MLSEVTLYTLGKTPLGAGWGAQLGTWLGFCRPVRRNCLAGECVSVDPAPLSPALAPTCGPLCPVSANLPFFLVSVSGYSLLLYQGPQRSASPNLIPRGLLSPFKLSHHPGVFSLCPKVISWSCWVNFILCLNPFGISRSSAFRALKSSTCHVGLKAELESNCQGVLGWLQDVSEREAWGRNTG